jgi:hypothetical protein
MRSFRTFSAKIYKSLQPNLIKFPFSGDSDVTAGAIGNMAWSNNSGATPPMVSSSFDVQTSGGDALCNLSLMNNPDRGSSVLGGSFWSRECEGSVEI